jgi:glutaconate CoA-transferase subunit B
MAVMRFDAESGEAYLASTHPGASSDDIQAKTGWALRIAAGCQTTPPPTSEELRIIRDCDPTGFWLN